MEDYQQILERIIQKDKTGLELLYEAYGKKLYSFAIYRWNLNEDNSWEVVYQTLDTLILKLPGYTFESKTHFENFIFKVFKNFLKQFFRSQRRKQVEELVDMNSGSGENNNSATDNDEFDKSVHFEIDNNSFTEYYKNETLENPKLLELEKALEQLDPQERDILLLRAQNYSYAEIAAMLKIEDRQLKVKHHRTKSKLLKLLTINTKKNHA